MRPKGSEPSRAADALFAALVGAVGVKPREPPPEDPRRRKGTRRSPRRPGP